MAITTIPMTGAAAVVPVVIPEVIGEIPAAPAILAATGAILAVEILVAEATGRD